MSRQVKKKVVSQNGMPIAISATLKKKKEKKVSKSKKALERKVALFF